MLLIDAVGYVLSWLGRFGPVHLVTPTHHPAQVCLTVLLAYGFVGPPAVDPRAAFSFLNVYWKPLIFCLILRALVT